MVSPIEKNGDFYVSGLDSILSFNVDGGASQKQQFVSPEQHKLGGANIMQPPQMMAPNMPPQQVQMKHSGQFVAPQRMAQPHP